MSEPSPADSAFARKLVVAAAIQGAWLLLVIGAFLWTEEVRLLIGGVLLGAVPLSLWLARHAGSRQPLGRSSTVQGRPE